MSDQKYVIRKKFRRGDIESPHGLMNSVVWTQVLRDAKDPDSVTIEITMSPEAYQILEDHFREN